jgi:hypothetical protein
MTLFRKRKPAAPSTPQLCARCRRQMGSVLLTMTLQPGAKGESTEWWVCAGCANALQRDASDN